MPETNIAAAPPAGRRERKKAQTRQSLVDAARRLFYERGYDQVTVAQIATEADTAVTTLFKHFPDGKEALVFGDDADDDERATSLVAAVAGTGSVRAALAALREFLRGRGAFEADAPADRRRLLAFILATPQLRPYARHRWEVCEEPLAEALATEAGAPPDDAGMRALARYVLQVPDLASGATDAGAVLDAIFDRLEQGWG